MKNRRQKYRQYVQRLDATAAKKALEEGLYIAPPGQSIADRIVAKAELGITAAQVIVGGIGSGKTTQLLLAQQRLDKLEHGYGIYIESIAQEEDHRAVGGLLIASWLHRQKHLRSEAQELYQKLQEIGDRRDRPFLIEIRREMGKGLQNMLSSIHTATNRDIKLTVLFDSLDRISDLGTINEIIEQDIGAFLDEGISVVMVAPQRIMYGPERALLERFNEVYHQGPLDTDQADTRDFLYRVLRARAEEELLPDEPCRSLADFSGGVLRDLVSLARSAGEHAYLTGTGPIEMTHVEAAAEGLGRKKLLNLSREQIAVLQKTRTKGIFVQTSEQDLTLLLTGCVLEYQKPNGAPRYAVHPTIKPLLEQIAEEP